MKKVGLIIPVYNRAEYLKQCLDSLAQCELTDVTVVFINDNSTDAKVKELLSDFVSAKQEMKPFVINNVKNNGIKAVMAMGVDICLGAGCNVIINLDSDTMVKPNFIQVLTQLKEAYPDNIVSGFNCIKEENPYLEGIDNKGNSCQFKSYCNGINMCFDEKLYRKYILPALLIDGHWDKETSEHCITDKAPFVITTPSVVQHIGYTSTAGNYPPDHAADFSQLFIPDVTLFGVDAHDPAGLLRAAEISQRDVKFGAVKMITERLFSGREAYSEFCIKQLNKHFDTSHVLIIHPDGYVLNWKAWDDDFLNYDYIGATWGYKDNMNVGNGGFSLRSKKLCDAIANDPHIDDFHPEDDKICRKYRPYLEEKYSIKYAPEEVANRFSIEAYGAAAFPKGNFYNNSFGFHSVHVDFSESNIPEFLRIAR